MHHAIAPGEHSPFQGCIPGQNADTRCAFTLFLDIASLPVDINYALIQSRAQRINKQSMTYSQARARGRGIGATLDFLPSVLAVIQRASRVLEREVAKDNKAARDFLRSLRTASYSIQSIFRELRDAGQPGLDAALVEYAEVVLDAVEAGLSAEPLECASWKASNEFYPKSRALCRLADAEITSQRLSDAFSFPYSPAHEDLLSSLTDTFDKLQVCFPDLSELDVQPARKRRRDPQWGISDSACKVFWAISQCSHGPDCGVIKRLKTRLALATYSGINEGQEHFVDVLFAPDTETPLWDELRIHTHSHGSSVTDADNKSAVPKVRFPFPDNHVNERPATVILKPVWRPRPVKYFCKLLGTSKAHFNATFRVNVALDANNEVWQHRPTDRFLKQAELSHSISLGDILASDTRDLNEMAKLVLALILSYSLLYLYGGPWMGLQNAAGLNRDKIFFFRKDGKDGKVPLRPFLHSDFPGGGTDSTNQDDGSGDDDDDTPFHSYPVLVGFGILLLELHLGRTLESFLGLTEPLLSVDDKWACACDVFNQRKPFIPGQKYRDAIEACLDTQFGAGDEDAPSISEEAEAEDIEQLRSLIFSKIVVPLQDELDYGFGAFINADDLDEQAASMDLISGLSFADVVTGPEIQFPLSKRNHSAPKNDSTHKHMFSPEEESITTAPANPFVTAHITSRGPRNMSKREDDGDLHILFGDPNAHSTVSPHEYSPTDAWITKFRDLGPLSSLHMLEPGDSRRVRVAIIDTGIDMAHVDIHAAAVDGRIIKVCDWVDGRNGIEDESIGDSSGHGTHIASIMLDMAPNVDLYIARVTKGRKLSNAQAENIARAIHTACFTWGCTIINLSLGFTRGIQSIELELEAVINAGVLVFAAASNDGANSGLAYPAWRSRVLCVYSTDGYGNPSRFNPSPDEPGGGGLDGFSIVGEHISGAWPLSLSPGGDNGGTRRLSGTSFATPIAAALAACVLGFASLAFEPGKLETKSLLKLSSYDGMCRVLTQMVTNRRDPGYRYLNPFGFFGRENHEIKADIWRALNPEKNKY